MVVRRFRGRYGKKTFRRRRYNPGVKALKILNNMKKNEELKYGQAVVNLTIPIAGDVGQEQLLNALSQGDNYSQRSGSAVTIKDMSGNIVIKCNNVEANGCLVKCMVVLDRKPNGALGQWDTMHTDDTFDALIDIQDEARGRFQTIWSKTYAFGGSSMPLIRNVKFFKKWKKGIIARYGNGSAGDVTDFTKHSLIFMANGVGNAGTIDIDGPVRTRFTDD